MNPAHAPDVYAARRRALRALLPEPVLLLGNRERPRNLPGNDLPFRQDSTLLYFTGCALPGAAAWIDEDGCTLYLPEPPADDAMWHGALPTPKAIAFAHGLDGAAPRHTLEDRARQAQPHTLAVADPTVNAEASAWIGKPLAFGASPGSADLAFAVIQLRRKKGAEELTAMRHAAAITVAAHKVAMGATRPGRTEAQLHALFCAALGCRDAVEGYATILTQRGEVLHNHTHDATLQAGRLLLVDGGAEVASGHTADVTRTWPVSGTHTPRQRAAIEAVCEAQRAAISRCTPGTPYAEVHRTACLGVARFLVDEGLLQGITPEGAVEVGAHAMFFPHGTGHLIGLDVHDMRHLGEAVAYSTAHPRLQGFGSRYLRLTLPLESDWVVTVEPGFYLIPEVLKQPALRDAFGRYLNDAVIDDWMGFGGVRIEDDVRVRSEGAPEVLTDALPKSPDDIEPWIGNDPSLEDLLG